MVVKNHSSEKRAVATMALGDFEQLGRVTQPFLKQYAYKCRAKFLNLPELGMSCFDYNKLAVCELLDSFDAVLCLDADILVRSDCPDLFDLVPKGRIAGFNEFNHEPQAGFKEFCLNDMREIAARNGHPPPNLNPKWYLNAGLFLCDRTHQDIFRERPIRQEGAFMAQGWINLKIQESKTRVYQLPQCFNFMNRCGPAYLEEGYCIHYCGMGDGANRTKLVSEDVGRLMRRGYLVKNHHLL